MDAPLTAKLKALFLDAKGWAERYSLFSSEWVEHYQPLLDEKIAEEDYVEEALGEASVHVAEGTILVYAVEKKPKLTWSELKTDLTDQGILEHVHKTLKAELLTQG